MSSLRNKMVSFFGSYGFYREFRAFKALWMQAAPRFTLAWKDRFPILDERKGADGYDRHYLYHTAWASRVLAKTKPSKHVDISSSLYFNAIASAFVPFELYQYRSTNLMLSNLAQKQGDLLSLPFPDCSVESISCMHVIEHIGLGRYGDPLDPDGDRKAIRELKRVVSVNGSILIVVPMGEGKIVFNAHRLYTYDQVMEEFSDMRCEEFAFISDSLEDGAILYRPGREFMDRYPEGCGCFRFMKNPAGR